MPGCAVATCKSYSRDTKGKQIIYHSFPLDVKMQKVWIEKCKRKDSFNPKTGRICSLHFSVDSYVRDLKSELLGLSPKKRLKPDAVPTLNLPSFNNHQSCELNSISDFCNTTNSIPEVNRYEAREIRKRALESLKNVSPKKQKLDKLVSTEDLPFMSTEEQNLQNCKFLISAEDRKNDESVISDNVVEEEISELKGVDKLVEDLKNLLTDKESCDVVLKVEDSEFKAHRSILIARSPVFGSMFRHNTEKSVPGEVNIPDCSAAAFESFLLYLYTGNVDVISSENVHHLYHVADKFLINDLKLECAKYMENNLSVENVCAVMTLTMQYSDFGLLEKAATFFCDNVKEMVKTVQWQKYLKDYPIQANELLNA